MKKSNPMKRIYDSKAFWICASLLLSLMFWVYVTGVEEDTYTNTFSGVRVELVGEDILRENRNLVITDLDYNTVTVQISGPRKIVGSLSAADLTAHIDVSKLSRSAFTSQQYTVTFPSGTDISRLSVEKKSPEQVSFMVSNQTSRIIPVRGGFEGDIAEGFTAELPVFEPSTITVSGAEAYLKDIDHAWVSFGKGVEINSSYSVESGFTLIDAEGNSCSTAGIILSEDTVNATLPMLENKEVMLSVDLVEGAGANASNTKVSIEPLSVMLAGDSAILSGMNKIVLGTIDLTDFASTYSETYTIKLDNELKNLTGLTEAKVTVEVIGLSTKSFKIKNISHINAADGLEVNIVSESIDVVIRGSEESLSQLKAENIRAVVDLTDYKDGTGSYMVPARIYIDGFTDIGAIGDITVSVEISK